MRSHREYIITNHRGEVIVRKRIDAARFQLWQATYDMLAAFGMLDTNRGHEFYYSIYNFAFNILGGGAYGTNDAEVTYKAYSL